jgi:hypothetical protein
MHYIFVRYLFLVPSTVRGLEQGLSKCLFMMEESGETFKGVT